MDGPIGVLVEERALRRSLRGQKTNERIGLYRRIALDEGMNIVVFSIRGLRIKQNRVTGYKPVEKGWKKVSLRIPKIIHKRVLFRQSEALNKLAKLQRRGAIIVNPQRMQNKAIINSILSNDETVRPHLPWTRPYRWQLVEHQLSAGVPLLLKPRIGSVGRGIIKIVPLSNGQIQLTERSSRSVSMKGLKKYLRAHIRPKRYLVQQYLQLARYNGKLFDLRVPVQRDETRAWQVPDIVAKVAGKHPFLTNIAQGGRAIPGHIAIKAAFPSPKWEEAIRSIKHLALAVAQAVSKTYPHAADLGLDIGLGTDGKPWLIEVNTRDQRITFEEAGLKKAFRTLYRNPLAYCITLQKTARADRP